MLNKKMFIFCLAIMAAVMPGALRAEEEIVDVEVDMEQVSANAVADYQVEGSLFQQITDLEQEKVLMQLEKERAQLDLELDRLAAEKIKLHMEIDTLSGRAEAQQQELETEKAKLEAEAAKLARERAALEAEPVQTTSSRSFTATTSDNTADDSISNMYRLVNVIGAGSQLQATIEDISTGQNKRVKVGAIVNGFTVKSISLDDGIVFAKNGQTQSLNISNGN